MAKILVVEDDQALSALLSKWLKDERHVVDLVSTGEDALQLLDCFKYDLLILDWQLPGIQGDHVCMRYRARGGRTPVLFLTGRGDIQSRVEGLDAGADDYLSKPFSVEELAARLKALLRRVVNLSEENLSAGKLSLDLRTCEAIIGQQRFKLSSKELELLKFLVQNPNKHFSSRELLKNVWGPDTATAEQTVRSTISALRKKLSSISGSENEADCIIKTVPKLGFIIETEQC